MLRQEIRWTCPNTVEIWIRDTLSDSIATGKEIVLLTCYFLGQLVNTLATEKKYPVLNRQNLTIPSQMQFSEKQKSFSRSFAEFLKSRLNFERF